MLLCFSGSLPGLQLGDSGFCDKEITHGNTTNGVLKTICQLVLLLENKAFIENVDVLLPVMGEYVTSKLCTFSSY